MEEDLKEAQEERRKMIKEKGKEIVFRAKVQAMEEDEKCSRFFFKKAFSPKKVMKGMMDGPEDVRGERMRDVIRNFYVDLYGGEDGAARGEV